MLLKKSKTIRNLLLLKRPDFKLSPRPKLALAARAAPSWAGGSPSRRPSSTRSARARGVTRAQAAAWAWAGKAASRATPLGPHSAREAKARSWPSDQIRRPSAAPQIGRAHV